MSRPRVLLPPLPGPVSELWHTLLDLAERCPAPWTLVGGQMVLLHALEHGQVPPQISEDGDVLADVRAAPGAITDVVATLGLLSFSLASMSPDGIAHRYLRSGQLTGRVQIDVLAPEGLGRRASLTSTPPGHTIQVPGGTQALARTELVDIEHEQRVGTLPRPSLLAAVVGKSAACGLGGNVTRHYRDLALLYSIVPDPFALTGQLTRKDRSRLRIPAALSDPLHPAWALVPADIRNRGQQAFDILTELPSPR